MEFNRCTKEDPMPRDCDQTGQHWVHHDVTEIEDMDMMGVLYQCNSCGLRFIADNTRGS
jgi:hypothetical protein